MEISGQLHTLTPLSPGKQHLVPTELRGWVGPSNSVDISEMGKISCPCQVSNHHSLLIQPVA